MSKSSIRILGSGPTSAPPLELQYRACCWLLNFSGPSCTIFPLDDIIAVFASRHKILNFWVVCTKYSANLCFLMFVPNRTNKIGQLFYSHVLLHHCHFFSSIFLHPSRSLGVSSTFSPISAKSPPGSTSKSGRRAQASRTCWYLFSSNSDPKRMLSFTVPFWIQDCCGT